jgi:asparagine N-glycosylation enzyme membrane subunit Stt3
MDKRIAVLFAASFAIFMLAFALRHYYFGIDEIVGTPTFYHTRIAGSILEGQYYDDLSFGGRPLTYPPLFPLFHAGFALLFGLNLGGMIFVALFGALGIVSAYVFSRKYFSENALLAFFLVIMPGIIFLNSHISTRAIPIALGVLSLYLLSERRYLHSGIALGASFLFHPESAGIMLIVCLLYVMLEQKAEMRKFLRFILPVILIFFAWYAPFVAQNGLPQMNALHEEYRDRRYSLESPTAENFLWELGKGYFTVPLLALSAIGFFCTKNKFLRIWFIFGIALALTAERLFFYMLFPAAFMAVFGAVKVKSLIRKNFYIILIAIIVIYTAHFGFSRSIALAQDYPIRQQINAFHWMRDNTPEDAVILSDWQWGHWISGIAKRRNFVDGYAEYAPSVDKRISELHEFYRTCKVPSGYGISYIYMEDWFAERYDISCTSFQKVYDDSGIKIYKV